MQPSDVLKATYEISLMVLHSYVGDLSDQELMMRPASGCNHLAWQLGHLLASESGLVNSICPGMGMELPEGFAAAHGKDQGSVDAADQFLTKAEYLDLFEKSKVRALAAFESLSAEALDQPGPEHFRSMFPRVGDVAVLIATHVMMHVGQFVPVRRNLGKPVVI